MKYPKTVRTNMRHRGPVETIKLNRNITDTHDDIARLYKMTEALYEKFNQYHNQIHEGTEVIEGLGNYAARLDRAALQLLNIKRGVIHG